MRMRLGFGLGAAAGYILGTKAGRERYEQLKGAAGRVAHNPVARSAAATVQAQAEKVEHAVNEKLGRAKAPEVPPTTADGAAQYHAAVQQEAADAAQAAGSPPGSWGDRPTEGF